MSSRVIVRMGGIFVKDRSEDTGTVTVPVSLYIVPV
jgi:hypothetical protein